MFENLELKSLEERKKRLILVNDLLREDFFAHLPVYRRMEQNVNRGVSFFKFLASKKIVALALGIAGAVLFKKIRSLPFIKLVQRGLMVWNIISRLRSYTKKQ